MIGCLKGLTNINGKKVLTERPLKEDGTVDWEKFDELRNSSPIYIDHDTDMISFKMLTKPASEGGNTELCQLTELITTALIVTSCLNRKFPCRENEMTIDCLKEALDWQDERTADRTNRGVEGKELI